MAVPPKVSVASATSVGVTLLSYTHDAAETVALYFPYASFSAALVVKCVVKRIKPGPPPVTEDVDTVFAGAGGSHSWWDGAGGPLLDSPLLPGEQLLFTAFSMTPSPSDCALRLRFMPTAVSP